MNNEVDNTNRLRWTIIDGIVRDFQEEEEAHVTSSTSTNSASGMYYMPQIVNRIEPHGVLLKRLLKPMYHYMMQLTNQVDGGNSFKINDWQPTVDRKIYIDMSDKTMWIAVEDPKPLDDFYKMLVSNETIEEKYSGYTIDNKPSMNFVPLVELKQTFIEWWCN